MLSSDENAAFRPRPNHVEQWFKHFHHWLKHCLYHCFGHTPTGVCPDSWSLRIGVETNPQSKIRWRTEASSGGARSARPPSHAAGPTVPKQTQVAHAARGVRRTPRGKPFRSKLRWRAARGRAHAARGLRCTRPAGRPAGRQANSGGSGLRTTIVELFLGSPFWSKSGTSGTAGGLICLTGKAFLGTAFFSNAFQFPTQRGGL